MTAQSLGTPARVIVTRSPKRNVGMVNCGWFQSQPIEHESRLEKHFVLRAILSPLVKRIQHQPFKLELAHGKSYTPDFLLVFEDGEQAVFEVKRSNRVKESKERLDEIARLLLRDELLFFVVHEGQIEGRERLERAALMRRYAMLGMPDELVASVTNLVQQHPRGITVSTVLKRCSISRLQLLHLIALRKVCAGPTLAVDDNDPIFPPRQEMHDAARQFGVWFGCAPWCTNARIPRHDPWGKVQFEDQRTRLIQTFTLPRFYADMQNGNLVPVLANEVTYSAEHAAPLLLTSLSTLSPKRREELDWRMGYIRAVRRRGLTRGQRRAIGRALPGIAKERGESTPPSVDAVMSWMRRFEMAGDNPAAVVTRTRRRARRVHAVVEDAISNNLRSVYLTPSRNSLRDTLDLIDVDLRRKVKSGKLPEAEAKVSKATVYRRLQDIDPYDRDKARYGTNYARAKFRTSVEGVQAVRPLQRVECDHTPLNWVVICDHSLLPLGRPTLTVMVDSYSGYVVGLYVSFYGPGLTSVLNVLKNAIQPKDQIAADAGAANPWLAWGICETLLLDNGLEFHSRQYKLAATLLGMDVEYCRVRTPWMKPKVERFFANLDYFTLSGGRVFKPLQHYQNLDPNTDVCIFFSDFVRGLIKFVVDVYPFEPNSRRLRAPFDLFKEGMELLPPPAFLSSTRELDMVAAMSKEYTVSAGGVELHGISYSSEELAYLKKAVGSKFKTLVKWNPDDMSEVYLKDPRSDRWLIVPSLLPSYTTGLSFVQHRLIRAHLRAKHIEGGGAERLSRGREELREIWMTAQARGRGARNLKLAAKFSGLSSNRPRIEEASRSNGLPLPRPVVLAKEEVTDQHREVPSYETFRMR